MIKSSAVLAGAVLTVGAVTAFSVTSDQGEWLEGVDPGSGVARELLVEEGSEVETRTVSLDEGLKFEELSVDGRVVGTYAGPTRARVMPELIRLDDGDQLVAAVGAEMEYPPPGEHQDSDIEWTSNHVVALALATEDPDHYEAYLAGELDGPEVRELETRVGEELDDAAASAASLQLVLSSCVMHGNTSSSWWRTCEMSYNVVNDGDPNFWYNERALQGSGGGGGGQTLVSGQSWKQFGGGADMIVDRSPASFIPGDNCSTTTVGVSYVVTLTRSFSSCDGGHGPMHLANPLWFGVEHGTASNNSSTCPRDSAAVATVRIPTASSYTGQLWSAHDTIGISLCS